MITSVIKQHPVTFAMYLPRFAGLTAMACIIGSELLARHITNYTPYILLLIQALIWPNLALFISLKSDNSKRAEKIFMTIESASCGLWVVYLGFTYWVSSTYIIAVCLSNISFWGSRIFVRRVVEILVSIIVGIGIFGFTFHPYAQLRTAGLSIVFLFIFADVVALMVYYSNQSAKLSKGKLRHTIEELNQINHMLKESNASLEVDKVTDSFIHSLQEKGLHFNMATLQGLDASLKNWVFQTIIGDFLDKDNKDLLSKATLSVLDVNDSLASKVIHKQQYVYVPDVKNTILSSFDKEVHRIIGYRAIAIFPLIIKAKTAAIISFYSDSELKLTEEKITLIKNYISQISLIVNNALLYSKLDDKRTEVDRKNKQLNFLSVQLSKYISHQIFEKILQGEVNIEVGATRKKLTIFFSDIVGFTELSDNIASEELATLLNIYFDAMTKIAIKYGGTTDKYIGDAILVYFGDPETDGEIKDAYKCANMALEMQEKIQELQTQWNLHSDRALQIRMAIHSGYVAAGNFGCTFRMDYTIVGSAVNLVGYLQTLANPNEIVISETTYALIHDLFDVKPFKQIIIKGQETSLALYTLYK